MPITDPVTHEINTDPEQVDVLGEADVEVPGFLKVDPADLQNWWQCDVSTASITTEMPMRSAS